MVLHVIMSLFVAWLLASYTGLELLLIDGLEEWFGIQATLGSYYLLFLGIGVLSGWLAERKSKGN